MTSLTPINESIFLYLSVIGLLILIAFCFLVVTTFVATKAKLKGKSFKKTLYHYFEKY